MIRAGQHRAEPERGSAIIEFHFLGILLLVPLVYLMIAVLDVQRSAFALNQAAREAGRLYVATGDEAAAIAAAGVALTDQGVDPGQVRLSIACSARPCYQPGAEIDVSIATDVPLPFLPDALASTVHSVVPVHASHAAVVDRYRELW